MRGPLVWRVITAICLLKATIGTENERSPFKQDNMDKQTKRKADIQRKTKYSKVSYCKTVYYNIRTPYQ